MTIDELRNAIRAKHTSGERSTAPLLAALDVVDAVRAIGAAFDWKDECAALLAAGARLADFDAALAPPATASDQEKVE